MTTPVPQASSQTPQGAGSTPIPSPLPSRGKAGEGSNTTLGTFGVRAYLKFLPLLFAIFAHLGIDLTHTFIWRMSR